MKHKISILFIALLFILVAGCSDGPKPDPTIKEYMKNWQSMKFDKMYSMLSDKSKKEMTKDEFAKKYSAIYDGINAQNISITPVIPKEEPDPDMNGNVTYTYKVKMDTLAGPIQYKHKIKMAEQEKDDKKKWFVKWDYSQIFPGMEKGDKVRVQTNKAKRGEILDRNGNGLAVNGMAEQIGIVPQELPGNGDDSKQQLAKALGINKEVIDNALNSSWVKPGYFVPIKTIAEDDPRLKKILKIKGISSQSIETRVYPYKEAASHLTGFVQPIKAEELEKLKSEGYQSTDVIGRRGLEKFYEKQLRGKNGGLIRIVDEGENEKRAVAKKEAIDGKPVKLNIDMYLQRNLYNQMNKDVGTASAINPVTGEVLALVNSPGFDPNDFALGILGSRYQQLEKNPKQPLLNRFAYTFAPGSTFKPITAAIGLETNKLNPNKEVAISGKKWQKDKSWDKKFVTRVTEVPSVNVNLEKALIYSDNIYFAQAALAIGKEKMVKGAEKFGFNENMPFDLDFENSSLTKEDIDSEGMLADTGYGQGRVEMNILHLGLSYTPFINNGDLIAPKLVKEENPKPKIWKENVVSPETATRIRSSLVKVVEDKRGTGYNPPLKGIKLAGKTGTAELKSKVGEKGKENGWFVAFNQKQPNLLISMMIEDVQDKGGSHYVVPKVKKTFKTYMKEKPLH
ncbi:penicillin-binding transpeptidase domain-containing protein [Fictibacillus terranigra]|uniref:Penicillin-binding transpeptidase domain-containing protein n=1 Tax=Fictibacillus terranigra TaxID=3058424 RepID=A0ABT8EBN7_9BACL|nr:penicillin-binding transpeptidase domain-containing protein [Fictibacillus sp. CENA-BCM004]MDN4075282.1 penicillin-binding transpeptidase domain-containing protein [Fictibacillus sp. CENA-BCM004]